MSSSYFQALKNKGKKSNQSAYLPDSGLITTFKTATPKDSLINNLCITKINNGNINHKFKEGKEKMFIYFLLIFFSPLKI
jgi:hypothetical protein